MNSRVNDDFLDCYSRLPSEVRAQARRAYRLWRDDPSHPGVRFKPIHATEPIYSARVGRSWRALGLLQGDTITWFWVGSHAEYDALIETL